MIFNLKLSSFSIENGRDKMPISVAILLIIFGLLLPSWDVYSDVFFSYSLFNTPYYSYWDSETHSRIYRTHSTFGTVILIPVLISTLFTLPHWWRIEGNWRQRLKTFPLVLIQFWSQYRVLRVLVKGLWYQTSSWRREKMTFDKDIGALGNTSI